MLLGKKFRKKMVQFLIIKILGSKIENTRKNNEVID